MASDSVKVGRIVLKQRNGEDFLAEGQFKGGQFKTGGFLYESEGKRGKMYNVWIPKDSPLAKGFGVTEESKGDFFVNLYFEDNVELTPAGGVDEGPSF